MIAALFAAVVKIVYVVLLGSAGDVGVTALDVPESVAEVGEAPGAEGAEVGVHAGSLPEAPAPVASPPAPAEVILPELPEAPATDAPMCSSDVVSECWESDPADDVVTWDRPYVNGLPTPPHSAPPSEGG